jgi:hypothetical protein
LRALLGVHDLLVTVACRDHHFTAGLAPAQGRQDHTPLPHVLVPVVADTHTSIASRLTIVTTRSPLFIEAGWGIIDIYLRKTEEKYFCIRG